MVLSTAWQWSSLPSVLLSIILAFFFGYLLTFQSLVRRGNPVKKAIKTALATDTVSITSMEIVDNLFILLVPGAIHAELSTKLFWLSLALSLIVAFILTVPVNRWLLAGSHSHHH